MAGLVPLLIGHASGSLAFPTLRIEVAFNDPPGASNPIFTDITDYVMSFTVRRGKSRERDKNQAGSCSIVLDNRDRRFDPNHTAGPYTTLVLPMKRVRIRATWNTMYPVFDGFADSWDQQYEQSKNATCVLPATDGFKVLSAALLNNSSYELEVRADSPSIYFRLGEASGSTVTDAIVAQPLTSFGSGASLAATGLVTGDSNTALSLTGTTSGFSDTRSVFTAGSNTQSITIEALVKTTVTTDSTVFSVSDPGAGMRFRLYVSSAGKAVFEAGKTVGVNVSAATATSTTSVNDGRAHHIVGVYNPNDPAPDMDIYVDGVAEGTGDLVPTTFGGSQEICIGNVAAGFILPSVHAQGIVGTVDECALYTSALSGTRIAAHASAALTPWTGDTPAARLNRILDFMKWPSALRNLDTGTSVLQAATITGQSVLTHAQLVADSEFGQLFMTADGKVRLIGRAGNVDQTSQATFGDSGAELRYTEIQFDYADELIRNDVRIGRTGGSLQISSDATSITSFLRHTYQVDGLIHNSDAVSKNAADFLLNAYKDPLLRVTSITIAPQRDPSNLWPQVLGREIGDWVTIVRRPQGVGTAISQVCRIEGISHTFDAQDSLRWQTTWQLSPARTSATDDVYWKLGTAGFSELGQTTRLYF